MYKTFQLETRDVEIPGFEPGQTAPKTVVLPLHHISVSQLGVQK